MELITENATAELAAAVHKLREWQRGATHFTAGLYGLIAKADRANLERLRSAYPVETRAFELWQLACDEQEFFESWRQREA